ncbi:MAG TPA: hypothetical protein VFW96_20025 [Thermomicrobiales bacterium]|nr:hypothetical protein [Thermomicrobiales bacterium]
MAFRMQDLPRTVRRDRAAGQRRLYPRLLRDERLAPQLGIAIRYFETKLGLLRRDLDGEALTQLLGEPKLARCLVACLGRWYRYRTRTFADVLGDERAAALAGRGLAAPRELRALAYERANRAGGFVAPGARAGFMADLVDGLDLVEAEQLLWLDAADQAVLTRVGPVPDAADVATLYNLRALETVLRNARMARLALRGDADAVAAVCARHDVRAVVEGTTVTFSGRQDALGSWSRHGARVARAALTLLGAGVLGPGEAEARAGDDAYVVRLDAALLADALPPRAWSAPAATWDGLDGFIAALVAERRAGRLAGWRLKHWPEPLAAEPGALWAEFALTRGMHTIHLLPLDARQLRDGAAALGALAGHAPVVALTPGAPGALPALPDGLIALPPDAAGAAELAAHLERAYPTDTAVAPAWLAALADAARAAGSLAESDLARRLDCAEELVAGRLAAIGEVAPDVVYLDGFGLCAGDFLDRVRALVDEEGARNGGYLDLGLLGRRLRALTGRNEGLHALIAHFGRELRLAA